MKRPARVTCLRILSSTYQARRRAVILHDWKSLLEQGALETVTLPPGRKAISSKFAFKMEELADGNIRSIPDSSILGKTDDQQAWLDF
jgi:hypothetical protein